jgi:signal transduction histidine kinase/DNA-binding NarL/FixJ family response regulator
MFDYALVVDDNEASSYYLKALLESSGCRVEVARDGEEALRVARSAPPDIVISDLLMPVLDGYGLLTEWSEDPLLSGIPFVVYTGTFTTNEDKQLALHLGANAFLTKPMEPEILLESLRKVMTDFVPDSEIASEQKLKFARRHADVLVRKLTERNRELERERLAVKRENSEKKALLDALDANVAILNPDGKILMVNESWRRFARENDFPSTAHGVGDSYLEVVRGSDQTAIEEGIRSVLAGETPSYFNVYPCHGEGCKRWFRMLVTPLHRPGLGALVMHIDITERKLLEEQIERAQRMESIGAMASGVAHDLNNSLAPILLAAEFLQNAIEDETHRRRLSTILKSAERGRDLIKQLLAFARGDDGKRRLVPISESLNEVVQIARETFPRRITITASLDTGGVLVEADPTQLYQVFLNLCLNARDAIKHDGNIEIVASVVDSKDLEDEAGTAECVRVVIKDTGTGIPEENLDRIFEPFFTTKPKGQGTGLGLSTSKSIVESHNGRLLVSSEEGRGTTFQIDFPVRQGKRTEGSGSPGQELEGGVETILVVDDEATIRELVQRFLKIGGYQAVGAGNGLEALSKFRTSPEAYSLVLTDLSMPGMGGAEMVAEMRKLKPELKLIVCSGSGSPLDGPHNRLEQPFVFLPKPFTGGELIRAVKECLLVQR